MDYLSDKLSSVTGDALSSINELKRKRNKRGRVNNDEEENQAVHVAEASLESGRVAQTGGHRQLTSRMEATSPAQILRPHSFVAGSPFGGDTIAHPYQAPPIGFRTDILLNYHAGGQQAAPGNEPQENPRPSSSLGGEAAAREVRQPQYPRGGQQDLSASQRSLYEGDTWSRLWFQRVMVFTFIRLLLFIRKVYEDYLATRLYGHLPGQTGHFLAALASLFLPTIIFTIYRVSRYLQIVLPALREIGPPPLAPDSVAKDDPRPAVQSASNTAVKNRRTKGDEGVASGSDDARDDENGQLLSKQTKQVVTAATHNLPAETDGDGLVTARQTPTNLQEEFHDSKSQQDAEQATAALESGAQIPDARDTNVSPAPSTAIVKDSPEQLKRNELIIKESVDVDKLGNLPDKETTRVAIGASEQLLHGALFVFWQLKRQVDVLGYLVERSCLWRKPDEREREELGRLSTSSDGLEWFQDFYAAFLAILAQVYTLGHHWSATSSGSPVVSTFAGASAVPGSNLLAADSSELQVSKTAQILGDTLNRQILAGSSIDSKDLLILSELIVSSAVVMSLLVAVRRRDDGPLTLGLSMIGWGSIFASRIIVIALAFVHIAWRPMLALVVLHVLGITAWVYKIAINSHNGKSDESEESKWNIDNNENELEEEAGALEQGIELGAAANESAGTNQELKVTDKWSAMEHVTLLSQILTLFAIPSLFYWPIMFNLKLHYRPFKYLVLILSENFILIPTIWLSISQSTQATVGQWYLLGAVGGFSITGFVFVSLYIACKPSLTEYFAHADELFNEAEKSGVYYEFCSRVFKLPDLSLHKFRRLMNQSEQIEEVPEVATE